MKTRKNQRIKAKDRKNSRNPVKSFIIELAQIFGFLLIVQVGLVQAYHVPTGSMENTIMTGDVVFADKVTVGGRTPDWIGIPFTRIGFNIPACKLPGIRSVRQGDIVVVRTPADNKVPYVKRVVALGGQTVEVRDKTLYVDGQVVNDPENLKHNDPYTIPADYRQRGILSQMGNRDNFGPYQVPDDHVFLMGDNRDSSFDSRYFGALPASNIIGITRFVYWFWNPEGERLIGDKLQLSRIGTILK